MRTWQYFFVTDGEATPAARPVGLGRTDRDGVQYNAEMLGRHAVWIPSEFLMRYHLRGTNEDDYVEISEERAIEIVEEWVSSGIIPHWPEEPTRPVR
jgi:hypothetical protein